MVIIQISLCFCTDGKHVACKLAQGKGSRKGKDNFTTL